MGPYVPILCQIIKFKIVSGLYPFLKKNYVLFDSFIIQWFAALTIAVLAKKLLKRIYFE